MFDVDRAADIRQTIAFAQRENVRAIIRGGAEAWRVAAELAAAKIPVLVDPLQNLPSNFDAIGATLENAARLRAARVTVAFSMRSPEMIVPMLAVFLMRLTPSAGRQKGIE